MLQISAVFQRVLHPAKVNTHRWPQWTVNSSKQDWLALTDAAIDQLTQIKACQKINGNAIFDCFSVLLTGNERFCTQLIEIGIIRFWKQVLAVDSSLFSICTSKYAARYKLIFSILFLDVLVSVAHPECFTCRKKYNEENSMFLYSSLIFDF